MPFFRLSFRSSLLLLVIGGLLVGCKSRESTDELGQSASIEASEPMHEGYNRASQHERDLNISVRLPKGERGSKKPDKSMQLQTRLADDVDQRDAGDDDQYEMIPADVNHDYTVNIVDLLAVISKYLQDCPEPPADCSTDINMDSRTGVEDVILVISSWGQTMEAPPEEDEGGGGIFSSERLVTADPVVLDSVYYDFYARDDERAQLAIELDQGALTRGWNEKNDISVLPYVYNGGVDWYNDDQYTESDLELFEEWLDTNIPYDYDGPICLDMEGTWWPQFDWVATQEQMDVILDFYIQGLEYAEAMRPRAKFGYWGLPKKNHTVATYTGPSVTRLLLASGAIFPETYESNPGNDDSARMKRHIERCIELVQGRIPIHVQMSPRYRDPDLGGYRHFHEIDEIIRDQARPALDAQWQNDHGIHRVSSIALWDAYVYVRNYHDDWWSLTLEEVAELWNEVDLYHHEVYQALDELAGEYATPDDEADTDGSDMDGERDDKGMAG